MNTQVQPIFQAEPSIAQMLQKMQGDVFHVTQQHMHQYVRIQTIHGHTYEGQIVNVDPQHVYLQVSQDHGDTRQFFFNPYAAVLPLVLYELLVITLLL